MTQPSTERPGRAAPVASARSIAALVALGACVVVDAGWLLTMDDYHRDWRWLALGVAVAVHAAFVAVEWRARALGPRALLAAVGFLVALAVVIGPRGSSDVWSYAMYGRILGVHHVSPYSHWPAQFPHDRLVGRVAASWRHTPSVYGPLFNGISAVGALGYRTSPTAARLFYQCLTGVALLGAVGVMIARRVPTWAIALVALGPLTIATVNGAHNDLIVGLGILVGLWLLAEGRPRWSGAVMALASLVKLLGVPAAAGAVVALLLAKRWKDALELAASFALVLALGYVLAGGPGALHPLSKASQNLSSGSIMAGIAWFIRHPLGSRHIGLLGHPAQRSQLAAGAAVALFALFAFLQRHRPDPAVLACGALLIYLLTAPYALPWYAAALILPAALATPRLRWLSLVAFVALQAGHISSAGLQHAYVPFALYGARLAGCADLLVLVVLFAGVGRPDASPDGASEPAVASPGSA